MTVVSGHYRPQPVKLIGREYSGALFQPMMTEIDRWMQRYGEMLSVLVGGAGPGGSGSSALFPVMHWWAANGPFQVDTTVDGGRVSLASFTISAVWLYRITAGTSSSTILDLNKNGTTMYTTQANRPTIAFNDADSKVTCALPDVVSVGIGDLLSVDTDQIEAGDPSDWVLLIGGA